MAGRVSRGGDGVENGLAGMPELTTGFLDAAGQYVSQYDVQSGFHDSLLPSMLEDGLIDVDWLSAAPFEFGADASALAF